MYDKVEGTRSSKSSVNLYLTYKVTVPPPQKKKISIHIHRSEYFAVFVDGTWLETHLTLQASCSTSSVKLLCSALHAYSLSAV